MILKSYLFIYARPSFSQRSREQDIEVLRKIGRAVMTLPISVCFCNGWIGALLLISLSLRILLSLPPRHLFLCLLLSLKLFLKLFKAMSITLRHDPLCFNLCA
jgi:hypothetical protein